MRARHVVPCYVPSLREGVSRNAHDLAEALRRRSVDVHLEGLEASLGALDRRVVHLTNGWRAHRAVLAGLRDPAVDVVHVHVSFAAMGVWPRLARSRHRGGGTLVVHLWNAHYDRRDVHGEPGAVARGLHALLNGPRVARHALASADAVVVASRYQARQLEALGLGDRVHVVPNGVDIARFRPARPAERVAARGNLGLPDGPVVLYYGHASPWKGVDHLVEAAPEILAAVPEATLVLSLTRYGGRREAVAKRLRNLGVRDRVRFVKPRDPVELLAAADVGVVPLTAAVGTALHPNTVLEHLASGVPVVASRVGSLPEVVDHDRTGLLVEPADPGALAEAVGDLLADPPRRARLGEAARGDVVQRFPWSTAARRVAALYGSLAPTRTPWSPPGAGGGTEAEAEAGAGAEPRGEVP